jgi:transposase
LIIVIGRGGRRVVSVEQWAEIRRLYFVEKRSKRAISTRLGIHRDTVTRAVNATTPPRYARAPAGSKLDPFRDWICEQLREDPAVPSQRLRELAAEIGYSGGKSIFDDYVRVSRAIEKCRLIAIEKCRSSLAVSGVA